MIQDSNSNFYSKLQIQFQIQRDINFKFQHFELYSSSPTSIIYQLICVNWVSTKPFSVFLNLLGPPGTVFLVGVGVKNVFELYSSRLTSLILVVYLYLAYLILSRGWGWMVGKSDSKENPKSDLDLDLGFVNITKS